MPPRPNFCQLTDHHTRRAVAETRHHPSHIFGSAPRCPGYDAARLSAAAPVSSSSAHDWRLVCRWSLGQGQSSSSISLCYQAETTSAQSLYLKLGYIRLTKRAKIKSFLVQIYIYRRLVCEQVANTDGWKAVRELTAVDNDTIAATRHKELNKESDAIAFPPL